MAGGKGIFIVLEGADGTGKSTHAAMLGEYLKANGRDVVVTQEPTNGEIGRMIRRVLSGELKVTPRALALLFTADRAEHVAKEIAPALAAGKVVISDRYYHSTVVYQSAQGVPEDWIYQMNSFAPEPDLTIVLSVPPEQAIGRIKDRQKEVFEVLQIQKDIYQRFFEQVYKGPKRSLKLGKHVKVLEIGEGQTVDDVHRRICTIVDGIVK